MTKASLREEQFAKAYAATGKGSSAARKAGYADGPGIHVTASRLLRRPKVKAAIVAEIERNTHDYSPERVKRRLHEISHKAETDGQYGPAVRCEELIGKAAGMWIDQSLQLSGVLSDSHVAALLEYAKRRTIERVDNRDEDDDD